jgi:hypothetical protein
VSGRRPRLLCCLGAIPCSAGFCRSCIGVSRVPPYRLASLDFQHVPVAGGCNARLPAVHALDPERVPRIFTLQLAWESQREEPRDIAATLDAIGEVVSWVRMSELLVEYLQGAFKLAFKRPRGRCTGSAKLSAGDVLLSSFLQVDR